MPNLGLLNHLSLYKYIYNVLRSKFLAFLFLADQSLAVNFKAQKFPKSSYSESVKNNARNLHPIVLVKISVMDIHQKSENLLTGLLCGIQKNQCNPEGDRVEITLYIKSETRKVASIYVINVSFKWIIYQCQAAHDMTHLYPPYLRSLHHKTICR